MITFKQFLTEALNTSVFTGFLTSQNIRAIGDDLSNAGVEFDRLMFKEIDKDDFEILGTNDHSWRMKKLPAGVVYDYRHEGSKAVAAIMIFANGKKGQYVVVKVRDTGLLGTEVVSTNFSGRHENIEIDMRKFVALKSTKAFVALYKPFNEEGEKSEAKISNRHKLTAAQLDLLVSKSEAFRKIKGILAKAGVKIDQMVMGTAFGYRSDSRARQIENMLKTFDIDEKKYFLVRKGVTWSISFESMKQYFGEDADVVQEGLGGIIAYKPNKSDKFKFYVAELAHIRSENMEYKIRGLGTMSDELKYSFAAAKCNLREKHNKTPIKDLEDKIQKLEQLEDAMRAAIKTLEAEGVSEMLDNLFDDVLKFYQG